MAEELETLNKSNHGGAREGAGRPKSKATIATQKARELFCVRLERDFDVIYTALLTKASDGDVPAIRELFDRGWGKAVTPIISEDEEGNRTPLVFDVIFKERDSS